VTNSDQLLEKVWSEPRAALEEARTYLDALDESSHERAATLRAMSLAARLINLHDESIAFAEAGAEVAASVGSEELRSLNLLTLAGSLAIAGRTGEGLQIIEAAIESTADDHMRAKFQFQRGFVLNGLGEVLEARTAFLAALEVFRRLGDRQSIGSTLHNLGQINTQIGRLSEAERDLTEAVFIADELGERASMPGLEHNLGLLAAFRGDIPTALDRLTRSDELYMEISGASVPQHVARCEVLISAGLYREAMRLAREIAEGNREAGDAEHEARSLVVAAQAALHAGEHGEAESLAEMARERYLDQGRDARANEAAKVICEARFAREGASPGLREAVSALAEAFHDEGLLVPEAQMRLLSGRIALNLGDTGAATEALEDVASIRSGPPEIRVQAHVARALLRLSEGNQRAAGSAVRSGLRLIDDYQAALGASDLRMGIERQGRELGEMGLGLAVRSRRPRRILEWMDRTRARALRHQPVNPGRDDEISSLIADLRRVDADLRREENRADRSLLRRRSALQEKITRADRVRRREATDDVSYSTDDLIAELAGRGLVELAIREGRLLAVSFRDGRGRFLDLGDVDPILSELSHLRFALRRAARLGRQLDQGSVERLDRMIIGGFDPTDVVIVPPAPLMAVPWAALPSLRERSVTISPSAEMWWRARQRTPQGDRVVVAGGPDLEFADREVIEIAALYDSPVVLSPGSTVEQVKASLQGASIAHVVSHARFRAENPMFSSLRLGDGDLNIYDIERLETPPDIVVLSACDSGYTETRAGDELAGLTSALLSMGTRSIVASVGLVPDSLATSNLMAMFHRGLTSGLEPARALARARVELAGDPAGSLAAASFICVGA